MANAAFRTRASLNYRTRPRNCYQNFLGKTSRARSGRRVREGARRGGRAPHEDAETVGVETEPATVGGAGPLLKGAWRYLEGWNRSWRERGDGGAGLPGWAGT